MTCGLIQRVLFLASRVDPDRTSGGLCTAKYIRLLAGLGVDVGLLYGEGGVEETKLSVWFPGVRSRALDFGVGNGEFLHAVATSFDTGLRNGGGRRWICGKIQASFSYTSGFGPADWVKFRRWQGALERLARGADLVFAFGAGMDFTPHMALASREWGVPWVAYYHDPWPGHLYPEPYRWQWSIPGWHQESWHRKIVERASALAFPSERLMRWVLCGALEQYRGKAFILPHLAWSWVDAEDNGEHGGLPEAFWPGFFHVVHAGTLLRHRSPWALVEGFRRFVNASAEKRAKARLWLLGGVDRHLQGEGRWRELLGHPAVRVIPERLSYETALRMQAQASLAVIVEAIATESPFFPGKLADLLALRKAILAITPPQSTVRDLLGEDYPLLCLPDSAEMVASALEKAWAAWQAGRLHEIAAPEKAVQAASPEAAIQEIGRMVKFLKGRTVRQCE
jgi:hypothetical protein